MLYPFYSILYFIMTINVVLFYAEEICGNPIKAGFFNVIIQDIAVHGTND